MAEWGGAGRRDGRLSASTRWLVPGNSGPVRGVLKSHGFDVLSNDLSESCSMNCCLSVKFSICAGCFERSLKFINWEIFNYYRRDVNVAHSFLCSP